MYRSARTGHPIGLLDQALPKVIAAEPLERRLLKAARAGQLKAKTYEDRVAEARAAGVVTDTEADMLLEVHGLVSEIIAVDEFESDELRLGLRSVENVRASHAA